MNTLTTRHPLGLAPSRVTQRRSAAAPVKVATPSAQFSWMDRLADWADRRPEHRRLGSWVLYR